MPVTPAAKPAKEVSRISRFFGLKRVLAANIVIFVIVGWGFAGEYLRNRDMQREIDRLRSQAEELESKNLELARLGERFSTPEMIEREARTKLNLQKPGEQVVIVQDAGTAAPAESSPQASETPDEPGVSNAIKWWRYFFHRRP